MGKRGEWLKCVRRDRSGGMTMANDLFGQRAFVG